MVPFVDELEKRLLMITVWQSGSAWVGQEAGQQRPQIIPYFNPTYTRTGWIGQPPVLDRHEVVTDNGDVDTLRQATP